MLLTGVLLRSPYDAFDALHHMRRYSSQQIQTLAPSSLPCDSDPALCDFNCCIAIYPGLAVSQLVFAFYAAGLTAPLHEAQK